MDEVELPQLPQTLQPLYLPQSVVRQVQNLNVSAGLPVRPARPSLRVRGRKDLDSGLVSDLRFRQRERREKLGTGGKKEARDLKVDEMGEVGDLLQLVVVEVQLPQGRRYGVQTGHGGEEIVAETELGELGEAGEAGDGGDAGVGEVEQLRLVVEPGEHSLQRLLLRRLRSPSVRRHHRRLRIRTHHPRLALWEGIADGREKERERAARTGSRQSQNLSGVTAQRLGCNVKCLRTSFQGLSEAASYLRARRTRR